MIPCSWRCATAPAMSATMESQTVLTFLAVSSDPSVRARTRASERGMYSITLP